MVPPCEYLPQLYLAWNLYIHDAELPTNLLEINLMVAIKISY